MNELDAARKVNEIYEDHIDRLRREIAEAEQRGYRRGVQDAANHKELYGLSGVRRAILALLEQTEPGGMK